MAISKLAKMILAIFVLVVILIISPQLFEETKEVTKHIIQNVSVSFGSEELKGTKPTIPAEHDKAIKKLVRTINLVVESGVTDCFVNYQLKDYGKGSGLPDLGKKGTSLLFSEEGDKTVLSILGGAGGEQLVEVINIPQMKLCVVAGEEHSKIFAEVFYKKYFENQPRINSNYFFPRNNLLIAYDSPPVGSAQNRINYGFGFNDLEDHGWLFISEDKHTCFLPTFSFDSKWGCSAGKEGLDNDCFDLEREDSLPNLIKREGLLCSDKVGPAKVITVNFKPDQTLKSAEESIYTFVYDRVKKSWAYKRATSPDSDWFLVIEMPSLPGGLPDYMVVAEGLNHQGLSLNEEEGYDYFRNLNHADYNIETVAGVPEK